jgi:hypothetical protein
MIIGFGIGIGFKLGGVGATPPPVEVFATTEWQLYNANTWENITDTWT